MMIFSQWPRSGSELIECNLIEASRFSFERGRSVQRNYGSSTAGSAGAAAGAGCAGGGGGSLARRVRRYMYFSSCFTFVARVCCSVADFVSIVTYALLPSHTQLHRYVRINLGVKFVVN